MQIAIDGQFRSLPPSGTGSYLESLLHELPAVSGSDCISVVDRPDSLGPGFVSSRISRDPRLLRFAWESLGFAREAASSRPDLLHIPSFAAPIRSSIPFVVTIHDVIPFVLPEYRSSAPMRAHLAFMKRTTRRAALVLTPSQAAADDIHHVLGFPRHRIRVTPEAAGAQYVPGTGEIDPALAARFGIDGPYLFNVGGLDVRKRVDLLIEAFAAARPQLPAGTKLVIGGKAHSGNPAVYPDLAPVIARSGVGDAVVMTGWLSDDEKVALYQGADLYVTPSIYEGFGLTPLEAMACGTPVIAANRTSFPEVIGDAGLLIEPDVAAWRDAIVALMNDSARRSELSEQGRVRAAAYTWRKTAELTIEAYRDAYALARKGQG